MLPQEYFPQSWFIVNYGMKLLVISEGLAYSFNVWLANYRPLNSLYWAWILEGDKKPFVSLLNDFFGQPKEGWCALWKETAAGVSRRQAESTQQCPHTAHPSPGPSQSPGSIPSHPSPGPGDKARWRLSRKPPGFQGQPPLSEPRSLQAAARQAQSCTSRPSPAFSSLEAAMQNPEHSLRGRGRGEALRTAPGMKCTLSK